MFSFLRISFLLLRSCTMKIVSFKKTFILLGIKFLIDLIFSFPIKKVEIIKI